MNLLPLIEKIGLALSKQAAKQAGPVVARLFVSLSDLLSITVAIYVADIASDEKRELYSDSYRGLCQIVEELKEEGADIAGEIPTLLLESAPAVLFS